MSHTPFSCLHVLIQYIQLTMPSYRSISPRTPFRKEAVAVSVSLALLLTLLPIPHVLAQTLTRITDSPATTGGDNSSGVCWGDYDNDGDDDLFVANLSGQRNVLYHNDNGRLARVAGEFAAYGHSYSCSWGDYDNDGDLDLFVANLNGSNELYRNDGGTLRRVSDSPVVLDGGRSRDAPGATTTAMGFSTLRTPPGRSTSSTTTTGTALLLE